MTPDKTYSQKRAFEATPEPAPEVEGNVDPGAARPGTRFVIHQHHATRLHFDLRLEMMNGDVPVLASWAVPKNLPLEKGKPHLAVHVEDHPIEYGDFSGTIPKGNYGAGEVRIFDSGAYELSEQEDGKLTFRLDGSRLKGEWHLIRPKQNNEKDWLVFLRADERPPREPPPEPAPMLATLVKEPFDDDGWMFEPKWDGVRTMAVCAEKTMLMSRTKRDVTASYPELTRIHERTVALEAIMDGEIVAMEAGRPSFEKLQARINLQNPREIERAAKKIPVTYVAFDLIYLDGRSLTAMPVEERKRLLSEVIVPSGNFIVSDYVSGEGTALFEAARGARLEGIVAKKLGSPYRSGRRAKDWLKIKTTSEADLVVGGWSRGEGSRSSSFGALLLGAYSGDDLRFVGLVGTGFTERVIGNMVERLRALEAAETPFADDPTGITSGRFGKPLRDPRWVRPELVARIEFRELTHGIRLRAPSFKGLNPDVAPHEATLDALTEAAGGS